MVNYFLPAEDLKRIDCASVKLEAKTPEFPFQHWERVRLWLESGDSESGILFPPQPSFI